MESNCNTVNDNLLPINNGSQDGSLEDKDTRVKAIVPAYKGVSTSKLACHTRRSRNKATISLATSSWELVIYHANARTLVYAS